MSCMSHRLIIIIINFCAKLFQILLMKGLVMGTTRKYDGQKEGRSPYLYPHLKRDWITIDHSVPINYGDTNISFIIT
jgi:hypothetical protein